MIVMPPVYHTMYGIVVDVVICESHMCLALCKDLVCDSVACFGVNVAFDYFFLKLGEKGV